MNYYDRLTRKPAIYLTPKDFLAAVADYFQWCEDHPLLESKTFCYKGDIVEHDEPRMRPFTKKGLCTHLGIPSSRLATYSKRGPEWEDAMEMVEQAIYTQKFEGAAAGLLNSTIIIRDLGLAEKQEIGGLANAEPVAFVISPIASGTFLPPENMAVAETPA